jgi:hypothetical protein
MILKIFATLFPISTLNGHEFFFDNLFSVLPIKVWREEVERDGSEKMRELVIDREKLRGFFRQATAHSVM